MPSGQRDRSQGHGGLVAAEPPPDRTQVLPGALCLVPAGLERNNRAAARHPDERGRGSLERTRGLVSTQATQSRRIRGCCHGLVEEDKTGVVDDDDIGLTGAHEGSRSHGITQRNSRIDVTADER